MEVQSSVTGLLLPCGGDCFRRCYSRFWWYLPKRGYWPLHYKRWHELWIECVVIARVLCFTNSRLVVRAWPASWAEHGETSLMLLLFMMMVGFRHTTTLPSLENGHDNIGRVLCSPCMPPALPSILKMPVHLAPCSYTPLVYGHHKTPVLVILHSKLLDDYHGSGCLVRDWWQESKNPILISLANLRFFSGSCLGMSIVKWY